MGRAKQAEVASLTELMHPRTSSVNYRDYIHDITISTMRVEVEPGNLMSANRSSRRTLLYAECCMLNWDSVSGMRHRLIRQALSFSHRGYCKSDRPSSDQA